MITKENIKIISISLFVSIIFFGLGIFTINKIKNKDFKNPKNETVIDSNLNKTEDKTTTLYFVGDMMLTRGIESSVKKNFGNDYNKLFENLSILKDSDILFGNLEGDVSDKGNNVGSKYSFRMNPEVLLALKKAGFDIVSFANNHVGDWNIEAFKDTLSRLKEIDILKTGAGLNKEEAVSPTIIEKNGIKFGFLGFSDVGPKWLEAKDKTSGILLASDPQINQIIVDAKMKCDVLIVSFHFGEEYKTIHNKRQEYLAHTAIDNGADIIIGHHPHVIQDIEEYKGKPIVYSLGNFIFDQHFSKETMRGMLFSITYKNKDLIKTESKIITLNKLYQPEGIFSINEIKEKDDLLSNSCPKPKKQYNDMFLLNIGQNISFPDKTYIPKDLREIDIEYSTKENICIIKEARDAFELMAKEAKKNNLKLKVSSGFRSYDTQKILFQNDLIKTGKETSISVAKEGYSEHQIGTTVDITGSSINYLSASNNFDNIPEDKWLKENAYLYGFIQSYPKGKEDITGYKYEPWHYRYLGIENAKRITELDTTITEFLK